MINLLSQRQCLEIELTEFVSGAQRTIVDSESVVERSIDRGLCSALGIF